VAASVAASVAAPGVTSSPADSTLAAQMAGYVDSTYTGQYANRDAMGTGPMALLSAVDGHELRRLINPAQPSDVILAAKQPTNLPWFYFARDRMVGNDLVVTVERVPVAGGKAQLIAKLPAYSQPEVAVSWDGTRLAYLLTEDESKTQQLVVQATEPGAAAKTSTIASGLLAGWLPDGHTIVLYPNAIPGGDPRTSTAITSIDVDGDVSRITPIWTVPVQAANPCGVTASAAAVSASGEIAVAWGGCGAPASGPLPPPVVSFLRDGKVVQQTTLNGEIGWSPYDVQFTGTGNDVIVRLSHQDCMTGPGDVVHVVGADSTKLPTSLSCG
jgi:hypothetical protein